MAFTNHNSSNIADLAHSIGRRENEIKYGPDIVCHIAKTDLVQLAHKLIEELAKDGYTQESILRPKE